MTNITHKRTKKGNKSTVTLQPIKMQSAGFAQRIKISPHFIFFLAEKEISESLRSLGRDAQIPTEFSSHRFPVLVSNSGNTDSSEIVNYYYEMPKAAV